MFIRPHAAYILSLSLLASLAIAEPPAAPKVLYAFDSPAELNHIQARETALELTADKALRVTFNPTPWPNAQFSPADKQPEDWSAFGAIALDVANPGVEPITFFLRIDDDANSMGDNAHSRTGTATLAAGTSGIFWLSFSPSDSMKTHGMRAGPP